MVLIDIFSELLHQLLDRERGLAQEGGDGNATLWAIFQFGGYKQARIQ